MAELASLQQELRCPGCDRVHQEDGRFCPLCGYNLSGLMEARRRNSLIGQVIAERYRVRKAVGRGGMGVVYQVEHILMGKVMAMKVLHPKWKAGSHQAKRFRQEIRVVSRLSHVNTVSVFDCGETKDGSLYIVMEYLSGHDLEWLIQRETVLSPERTALIARQVCSSLAEAHARGIIHRDIKPANIFLLREQLESDFVKVLDFGIAKLIEPGQENFTEAGLIVGTPYYMSPEQAQGSSALGPGTDIYSLGVVMYEMVTGQLPFQGHTVGDFIEAHLRQAPRLPSQVAKSQEIDLEFEAIIMRAMQKEPAQRFGSIADMKAALSGYLERQAQRRVIASPLSVELAYDPAGVGALTTLDVPALIDTPHQTKQFQRETISSPPPSSELPLGWRERGEAERVVPAANPSRRATTVDKKPKKPAAPESPEPPSISLGSELLLDSHVQSKENEAGEDKRPAWEPKFEETVPAELVASRADWDRVERRWRRRSMMRSFFLFLLVGGFLGGGGWGAWHFRKRLLPNYFPTPVTRLRKEREPNNSILQATPIEIGPVIRGELGERLKTQSSDRDWFRIDLPTSGKFLLSIRLTPPETIDVELGVYRLRREVKGLHTVHQPVELFSVNNQLRGGEESVRRYLFAGGSYYILVRELVIPGEAPQEFRGHYKLQIKHESLRKNEEVEPNDEMGRAGNVVLDQLHLGYHDRSGDVDFYRLNVPLSQRKQRYVLRIFEVPGVEAQYLLLNAQGSIHNMQFRRYRRRIRLTKQLKAVGFPRRQFVREIRFVTNQRLYLRIKTIKGFHHQWPYRLSLKKR